MTIDEAVKILEKEKGIAEFRGMVKLPQVYQLSIEALKRIKLNRNIDIPVIWLKLPGETEK